MASSSPPVTSNSNETAAKSLASTLTSPTRPSDQLAASVSGSLHSSPISDDPFSIAASQPTFGATASAHTAFNSNSTSLEPLFGATTAAPTTFGSSATGDAVFGSNTFAPSFGATLPCLLRLLFQILLLHQLSQLWCYHRQHGPVLWVPKVCN